MYTQKLAKKQQQKLGKNNKNQHKPLINKDLPNASAISKFTFAIYIYIYIYIYI